MTDVKKLHIYASETSHEEAWLVGNKEALLSLRHAIDRALTQGSAVTSATSGDGEEFNIMVLQTPGHVEFEELALPYAQANWDSGKYPIAMCGSKRYVELSELARTQHLPKPFVHKECENFDCSLYLLHQEESYMKHCVCGGEFIQNKCESDK